ncbi:hypothetical protein NM208_g5090 [Fusarium decemcellulare]|uniref:Uncharacterized protein n=1 Tax=Fusarium decemcellulare TaxID=57161 RepID=A0ACC1SIL0_9HYPO|nr:hypothetical protein NM208_g5090 [Fusarium decemcellulare]
MSRSSIMGLPARFVRNKPGSSCGNCRKRRVHCDMGSPQCSRCVTKGINCPGYAVSLLRWKSVDHHVESARRAQRPASMCVSISPPFHILEAGGNDGSFLDRYFAKVAPILSTSMATDSRNPFGIHLRQFLSQNGAMRHTLISIGAIQDSFFNKSSLHDAWIHRATACRLLRRDLDKGQGGEGMMYSVVLLGLTENSFDTQNEKPYHVHAARALVREHQKLGLPGPTALANAVLWMEVQACFVYDNNDYDFDTRPRLFASSDGEARDPLLLLQDWGPLFQLVGRAACTARKAMQGGITVNLQPTAQSIVTALATIQICEDPAFNNGQVSDAHLMGEAHRLAAMLLLYHYFPQLDTLEHKTSEDTNVGFFKGLLDRTMRCLRAIPLSSSVWHVARIPMLSAGQFARNADDRDFVRTAMREVTKRVSMPHVDLPMALLEECWKSNDRGTMVTWMEIMASRGLRALMS